MPMLASLQRSAAERDMNVTPMLDVMLVLLVTFISAAVQVHHTVDAQVPNECTGACEGTGEIVLEVHPGPRYVINGTTVDARALASRLTAIFAGRPDKILQVAGFNGVTYQQVVTAMDVARTAGVTVIGMPDLRPHDRK